MKRQPLQPVAGFFDDNTEDTKMMEDPEVMIRLANEYKREGNLFAEEGDYSKALYFYQKAIEINPNNAILYELIAQVYLQVGDKQLYAINFAQKATQIDPNWWEGFVTLARSQREFGEVSNSIYSYKKAIELYLADKQNDITNSEYLEIVQELYEMETVLTKINDQKHELSLKMQQDSDKDAKEVSTCMLNLASRPLVNGPSNDATITMKLIKNNEYIIRTATESDTEALRLFGMKAFSRQFSHLYPPEELQYFLTSSYCHEKFLMWINNTKDYMLQIAVNGTTIVGYVLCGPCELPHIDVTNSCVELRRLYVDSNYFGSGLSKALMLIGVKWLQEKRQLNFETNHVWGKVWLGVYSDNFRAQKFYNKFNFKKIGEYFYEVGRCKDLEYIMQMQE